MKPITYLSVGQSWVRADGQDRVRLVDVHDYRWVAEHEFGNRTEFTAAELRASYELDSHD